MTDKAVQYYIDKLKQLDVRVDFCPDNVFYISIYNDRTGNHSVGFSCNAKELQGLADFFNRVCQINNVIKQDIVTKNE